MKKYRTKEKTASREKMLFLIITLLLNSAQKRSKAQCLMHDSLLRGI